MVQTTVSFQNKNVFGVKELIEFLIEKEFRIVAVVFDPNRGDGFVVLNKEIPSKLRGEILDWNFMEG